MLFAIHLTQSAQVWASTGRQTRCSILATKVRYLMAMALFLTYIGLKNLVLDLILALQTLPTARLLPSPNNRGIFFGDLSRFYAVVDSDDFDIKSVVPLLEQVPPASYLPKLSGGPRPRLGPQRPGFKLICGPGPSFRHAPHHALRKLHCEVAAQR
jgi:hypothetical protein